MAPMWSESVIQQWQTAEPLLEVTVETGMYAVNTSQEKTFILTEQE